MKITLLLHTEDQSKLRNLFSQIKNKIDKTKTCIILNAKGYFPWEIEDLKSEITSYSEYVAYPTDKFPPDSIVEILLKTKNDDVIILNEEYDNFEIKKDVFDIFSSIYCNKKDLLRLNLDTKYKTLKWFFTDIFFQKNNIIINSDNSLDNKRFEQKILSPLFNEKIIYIDGGLGDHVMALPLLESVAKNIYVSCKYPFIYEHLPIKGIIHWTDDLFGGYNRFIYQYGSANNSKTIIDAFFEIYGYERSTSDILKYNGKKESNPDIITDKKIALICTSAAKIQNLDSNKDWRDIRWLKLVHELKKEDYFVIQVGTTSDNQIPNVDLKFLDKPIPNLAKLIEDSSLWISVDTFFHHFASAIKPEVGVCLTPYYNDHAKHYGVTYIEKDCGKNFSDRKWWLDLQQPERKECMDLIQCEDVLNVLKNKKYIVNRNIEYRFDIINELIKKNNYKSYLEIGVKNPDDCFNKINCDLKHGVDPCIEGEFPVTFKMTSDEFFNFNTLKYDIIFIDGLHIDEQVGKDIINSFNILNEGGTIVLHDCNPPTYNHARENYYDLLTPAVDAWNGTVWKAIVKTRNDIKDIFTSVVDLDWGVGIMQKSDKPNPIVNDNIYFSFKKFEDNRNYYLNLINVDEFKRIYLGEERIIK